MRSILIRAVDKPKWNGNDAFTEIKLRKESWFSKKSIYGVCAIVGISPGFVCSIPTIEVTEDRLLV